MISANLSAIFYLVSGILFILALRGLSSPDTSRQGNYFGIAGMIIAIVVTFLSIGNFSSSLAYVIILLIVGGTIGAIIAFKIPMTAMPELVAGFHSLVGLAAVFVAIAAFLAPEAFNLGFQGDIKLASLIEMSIGAAVGAITFSGSIIAFGKLQGILTGNPIVFKFQHLFNLLLALVILYLIYLFVVNQEINIFIILAVLSFIIGILIIIPIGGADMPVVISLLNSYSGIAAASTGFVLNNNALIISGALVGASGLILTNIMCKGMNRSLANVIFGAVGLDQGSSENGEAKQINVKSYSTEEAAMIFDAAEKIIVVPGYGLAVAQAQHAVREVADFLSKKGKKVLYAIHPVAGRMPGHMNVLLAEANISYEQLKDLDEVNNEFEDCDVALVLGANDVVNPAARHDSSSPIFGMPILDVDKSQTVIINKRTMNTGFAGVQNELFGYDNSIMVFGDAKDMLQQLLKDLKEL